MKLFISSSHHSLHNNLSFGSFSHLWNHNIILHLGTARLTCINEDIKLLYNNDKTTHINLITTTGKRINYNVHFLTVFAVWNTPWIRMATVQTATMATMETATSEHRGSLLTRVEKSSCRTIRFWCVTTPTRLREYKPVYYYCV